MDNLKTIATMKIEVLSPVHIGDGTKLQRGLDFVIYDHVKGTFVLDGVKFIDWAFPDEDNIDPDLMNSKPGDLLAREKPEALDVWRYRMAGQPEKNEIDAHIKDVYGHVYIPGSSLKGMMRTAFVRGIYIATDQKPDLSRLNRNRKWAGGSVEREVMGRNPNYDLFRAIHVSDTPALMMDVLRVAATSIFPTGNKGRQGVIVDVEAIREGTTFESRLTLDEYGFRDNPALVLDWGNKRQQIETLLIPALQDFGRVRILQEREFYKGREDARTAHNFYRGLIKRYKELKDNQFLAQIGWGTGWNSKTLNDLVLEDKKQFARLVSDYRLQAKHSSAFKPGDNFPVSRTVIRQGEQLVRPMGWVLVTVA